MAIEHALLNAKVFHKRTTPKENSFTYSQYYLVLKASEEWDGLPAVLSKNKFNLFSFSFDKYGQKDGSNPYAYALELLQSRCEDCHWLKDIYLITQPKILGWAFNPVSFWLYIDDQDQIRTVLSEVNNTFGEHHKYLAHHDDFRPIQEEEMLGTDKVFYVSPFYKVEGSYSFRFKWHPKSVGIWIDYLDASKNLTLNTSLTGRKTPLTSWNLIKAFCRIPVANLKTVGLIHWQALKIWLKRISYVPRKEHKNKEVTRCR